jgi:Cu/Ag efflux pump CusA
MQWAEWVLRYRHAVIALLLAALVLGVQARFQLPVQLFPDTDPPTVTVITDIREWRRRTWMRISPVCSKRSSPASTA